MLSFDLAHRPVYKRYYREVVIALSRVFYSNCLIKEVLHFVVDHPDQQPRLVVERELSCTGPSKALKILKEKKLLASVGEIGVQLWDLSTLEQVKWIEISPMYLCAAIFSDEKTVVVGRDCLHFWDIETGKKVRELPCLSQTRMLALNEDESILAGADFFSKINLYNVASGELLRTLESPTAYPAIEFSLTKSIMHVFRDGDIYKLNTESGDSQILYSVKQLEIDAIKEYPGSLLVSVYHKQVFGYQKPVSPHKGPPNELELWDLATKEKRWTSHHKTRLTGIFDIGRCVVSGGEREAINLWDLETGGLLASYYGGNDRAFIRFEITPDRQRLIASTNAGLIMVFNLS